MLYINNILTAIFVYGNNNQIIYFLYFKIKIFTNKNDGYLMLRNSAYFVYFLYVYADRKNSVNIINY